ncbi:organic hydroperoxide resistance protein [Amphibacillus sediminis]|uniref:organic hydroperoxide resistance protein n=1 Tax=Amphibacillus sediminis TaxID=360185 RepID=UPI000834EAEF|nr:organic hydroperoxide resistance protein [Amphibacillus sediminis]
MSKILFTAHATAQGGREGHVKSDDGLIDLNLVDPSGKSNAEGSNPEQLFAAGYSACFDGALNLIASRQKKKINSNVTADVSLQTDPQDEGFKIGVVLNVEVEGVDQTEAEELVKQAHEFCPYSKATRGNIEVKLNVTSV